MKKTLFTIIICLACSLIYAQQPEFVYSGARAVEYRYNYTDINYPTHLLLNNSTKSEVILDFYSAEEFQYQKQIKFHATTSQYDSIAYVHLSSYADLILVATENTSLKNDYTNNAKQNLKMYDIKGKLLYDFGEGRQVFGYLITPISNDKLLATIYRYTYNEGVINDSYIEYYYITVQIENSVQNVQVEKKAAFPCPARGEVNIPTRGQKGNLRVLNLNGQTIDAQRIQEGDYQRVNTESYPAGTYIYQAGNETGKFMVE